MEYKEVKKEAKEANKKDAHIQTNKDNVYKKEVLE
jgi:hypothetical protein